MLVLLEISIYTSERAKSYPKSIHILAFHNHIVVAAQQTSLHATRVLKLQEIRCRIGSQRGVVATPAIPLKRQAQHVRPSRARRKRGASKLQADARKLSINSTNSTTSPASSCELSTFLLSFRKCTSEWWSASTQSECRQ